MKKFIQNCIDTKAVNYKYKDAWYKVKNRNSVGDLSYLYDKFNPSSEIDFYNKYIEDGVTSTCTDIRKRGRSNAELSNLCDRYMYYSNTTDRREAYNNLIYHIICETYRGHQKERDLMNYVKERGFNVEKANSDDDAVLGIDLIVSNEKQKFFIQVKPISFFLGNYSNWDLMNDRKLALDKREKAKEKYGCETYFCIYQLKDDGETEWLVNNKRILHNYKDLLNTDGTSNKIQGDFKKLS